MCVCEATSVVHNACQLRILTLVGLPVDSHWSMSRIIKVIMYMLLERITE